MVRESGTHDLAPFIRDKLFISIYESCRHRKTPANDAGALTQTVLNKILSGLEGGTVNRNSIIMAVTDTLKNFDSAAATMYSAYHKLQD
jgi:transcriptional regulator NrdR family protein